MDKVEKIKTLLNKKIERRPTFGTDPNEPWSVRAGITESSGSLLDRYLNSRGINPKFLSKYTRISHAKSSAFQQWKRDHMFEEIEVDESKTLQHTPVEIRQHAINKEKHMTKVLTHNGLHKEETIEEKNVPTSPEKWARAKAQAKAKFAVYPSAYANGWASKKYKSMGGGWKSVSEESEQLDELAPETLASYVLKTSSKDPNRAEPRKKAMSKLAKTMAKRPADPNATRVSTNIFGEEKKPKMTALDKFRKAAAEREKKHSQYEKPTGDLKGAIDRLEKHLNKEEAGISKAKETSFHKKLDTLVHKTFGKRKDELKMKEEVVTEKNDSHTHAAHYEDPKTGEWTGINLLVAKDDDDAIRQAHEKCKEGCRLTKVERHITVKEEVGLDEAVTVKKTYNDKHESEHEVYHNNKRIGYIVHDKKSGTHTAYHSPTSHDEKGHADDYGQIDDFHDHADAVNTIKRSANVSMHEEVEQIDELKKSTVKSWLNQQPVVPEKKPGMDRKAHNQRIKTRSKSWDRAIDRLTGHKPTSEDVFQDTQAATQTAFDMGTQADDREPVYSKKKEMSKSARMIKSLYKKHRMVKEELYDHEKEDKSVAGYGKKPKVEKQEVYDDDQAAMVLSGGKTLTGQTRDTLEIDPVLRKPVKPDNKQQINKQQ
jgi:hypothetical protein